MYLIIIIAIIVLLLPFNNDTKLIYKHTKIYKCTEKTHEVST